MNGEDVCTAKALDGEFRIPGHFKLVETRGQGSYGVVVSARDIRSGQYVAIKKNKNVYPVYYPLEKTPGKFVINKKYPHRSVTSQKRILREFKILTHIGVHPNIVTLNGTILPESFEKFSDLYFIMDLMECDLKTIIESDQEITNDHVRFFMYQILIALNYIHSANILHRDLKPENILLNSDCELKLCDFGLARHIDINENMSTSFVVSRWYRSPELLLANAKINTGTIDIWSCACIFAELLSTLSKHNKGKVLFPGINPVDQLQKIIQVLGFPTQSDINASCDSVEAKKFLKNYKYVKGIPLKKLYPEAESAAIDLLNKMLTFNPYKRITSKDALKHKYFQCYFNSTDLEPKPTLFDYGFEKMSTSEELKYEAYNAIVDFYKKEKKKDARKKKRGTYRKLHEELESPIVFGNLTPDSDRDSNM